jgi:hypothetical protein
MMSLLSWTCHRLERSVVSASGSVGWWRSNSSSTYTSERGTSGTYGTALSKLPQEPSRNTRSSHRLVSASEAAGVLVRRARLVQITLELDITVVEDRPLLYATLEIALMNSPAYPVTMKSSSQKLCHISEGSSRVLVTYLALAVVLPKVEGYGFSGYDTENDIVSRHPVTSGYKDERWFLVVNVSLGTCRYKCDNAKIQEWDSGFHIASTGVRVGVSSACIMNSVSIW